MKAAHLKRGTEVVWHVSPCADEYELWADGHQLRRATVVADAAAGHVAVTGPDGTQAVITTRQAVMTAGEWESFCATQHARLTRLLDAQRTLLERDQTAVPLQCSLRPNGRVWLQVGSDDVQRAVELLVSADPGHPAQSARELLEQLHARWNPERGRMDVIEPVNRYPKLLAAPYGLPPAQGKVVISLDRNPSAGPLNPRLLRVTVTDLSVLDR